MTVDVLVVIHSVVNILGPCLVTHRYPNHLQLALVQNYRSRPNILTCAQGMLSTPEAHVMPKELVPTKSDDGRSVTLAIEFAVVNGNLVKCSDQVLPMLSVTHQVGCLYAILSYICSALLRVAMCLTTEMGSMSYVNSSSVACVMGEAIQELSCSASALSHVILLGTSLGPVCFYTYHVHATFGLRCHAFRPVEFWDTLDCRQEAQNVAAEMRRLHDSEGVSYGDMAVLMRVFNKSHKGTGRKKTYHEVRNLICSKGFERSRGIGLHVPRARVWQCLDRGWVINLKEKIRRLAANKVGSGELLRLHIFG